MFFNLIARICAGLMISLTFGSLASANSISVRVIDSKGSPIDEAVVYAEPLSAKPLATPATAAIEQRGKRFIPLVTVVQTGAAISFPNNDKVRHHVYSFSPAKKFELKLYSGVPANPVVFDKAGTVTLGCNIHDFMLAFVQVVDTPYFGKTDGNGNSILELPPGDYRLKTWHYALAKENEPVEQKLAVSEKNLSINVVLELKPFPLPEAP